MTPLRKDEVAEAALDRFSLRFLGSEWEQAYRDESFLGARAQAQLWAAAGCVFYPLFALADRWLAPLTYPAVWGLRLGLVAPLLVLVTWLLRRACAGQRRRAAERLVIAGLALAALAPLGFAALSPPESRFVYFVQFLVVLLFGQGFVLLRFGQAARVSLLLAAGHLLLAAAGRLLPDESLRPSLVLLCAVLLIVTFTKYNQELAQRRVFRKAWQLRLEQRRSDQLAHYDAVTGLPNRALGLDRLARALAAAQRRQHLVGVLFVDLDHFKKVNDTSGHTTGDQVLAGAARRLQDCVREEDTVARFGGDEFLVLLPTLRHSHDAELVARKVVEAFARPFSLAGQEYPLSASVGICLYPADGRDASELLQNADAAMYLAKQEGRNAYRFFRAQLNRAAQRRLQLEAGLRHAQARGELSLVYQPIVRLATGEVAGAEALLRWRSAQLGEVAPAEFVPIAEETGLIVPIGDWVFEQACLQARAWERDGGPSVRLAVNLSSRQLRDPGLPERLARLLRSSGVPPARLELEITESMLLGEGPVSLQALARLAELGVRLSVDDFGTGYSSLAYLRRLPVHTVKMDRVFIEDVPGDPRATALVEGILALAARLGLEVVAEGVERQEQWDFVRRSGCGFAQGFFVAPPRPPAPRPTPIPVAAAHPAPAAG